MDLAHRLRSLETFGRFPERVRALSENAHRILGPALIGASLFLGYQGYQLARSEALRAWAKSHPPSQAVWAHALGARRMTALADPPRLQKLLSTLPELALSLDAEGTSWISIDGNWVALARSPSENPPFHIFCRDCATPPDSWETSGKSWPGFDATLSRLDALPARAPLEPRTRKSGVSRDPRELRY